MAKIKIKVTQEHIDSGVQKNSEYCPIAKSLEPLVKEDCIAIAHEDCEKDAQGKGECLYGTVQFDHDVYKLPKEALDFIHNFDQGEPVLPIEFEIEKVEE